MQTFSLLPMPRSLMLRDGQADLTGRLIVLRSAQPQELVFAGRSIAAALRKHGHDGWELAAGDAQPEELSGVVITVAPNAVNHPQGYQLTVEPAQISIIASTAVGAWYGALTLIQLLDQSPKALPCLQVIDWPDFANRGVMLDISRDKVPTLETLLGLIDELAAWKINQVQLYTEHTFAYRQHPEVWAKASPLTGEEILLLDAYCLERGIELVPNQNTFGHMRRWLTLDRYRPLAECPYGVDTGEAGWGVFDEPFTLAPEDPGSLALVRTLFDELLPHFSSRQVNVGCDETVELGLGRSAEAVKERGKARVYLDFLLAIGKEVAARGHTMQFWGDIVMQHPELVAELPRDIIALEWGYEADHPFEDHSGRFAAAGVPFYICPGTSSWNTLAGRTANALGNLRKAAEQGLKHGAIGYLNTDWGDNGHWQPLPVSYLGFAYGAAISWCVATNVDRDVMELLNTHVFHDQTGIAGRIFYELGDVYRAIGPAIHNSSLLFLILQRDPEQIRAFEGLSPEALEGVRDQIDEILAPLDASTIDRPDKATIGRELRWVADMMRHACNRATWVLNDQSAAGRAELLKEADRLIAEHREVWLARNRPGGLEDSQARLLTMRRDYEDDYARHARETVQSASA